VSCAVAGLSPIEEHFLWLTKGFVSRTLDGFNEDLLCDSFKDVLLRSEVSPP
jgi:hypothetical protein